MVFTIEELRNNPAALHSLTGGQPPPCTPPRRTRPDGAEETQLSSSPAPPSPSGPRATPVASTAPAQVIPAKRRTVEMMEYAQQEACQQHLTGDEGKELTRVSQMTSPRRSMWFAARLIKQGRNAGNVACAFAIPPLLKSKIVYYSFTVMTYASVSGYKKPSPASTVLDYLEKNPQWGLTQKVRNANDDYNVVTAAVGKAFTDLRLEAKALIKASVPWYLSDTDPLRKSDAMEIFALARAILNTLKPDNMATIPLSVEFIGRVAILRNVFCTATDRQKGLKPTNKGYDPTLKLYWNNVDKELAEFRKSPSTASTLINGLIKQDISLYGEDYEAVDMNALNGPLAELPETD
ncbi:hypothetical protein K525DRAFT_275042 [Schizophyllum commune Loenen D]|nr:hypothetical protein K525DRAFT_275042 [Schizophyllum commune Loenen D]